MALAHVTFIRYYNYEVEIDDTLYNEEPWTAEEQAIEDAYEQYRVFKSLPVADTYYDEVEIEVD